MAAPRGRPRRRRCGVPVRRLRSSAPYRAPASVPWIRAAARR